MDESTASDLQKLADLRSSGAITAEQYDRLAAPLLDRARRESSGTATVPGSHPGGTPQGPLMLRVAAAAGAGAIAGTLAADLLRNAIADPPPEVLQATIDSTTVYTEDGYVTESDITWENSSGEVVAEGTYTEEATWQEDPSANEHGSEYGDAGADFGGMEF
jgi:hypothetical protein